MFGGERERKEEIQEKSEKLFWKTLLGMIRIGALSATDELSSDFSYVQCQNNPTNWYYFKQAVNQQ